MHKIPAKSFSSSVCLSHACVARFLCDRWVSCLHLPPACRIKSTERDWAQWDKSSYEESDQNAHTHFTLPTFINQSLYSGNKANKLECTVWRRNNTKKDTNKLKPNRLTDRQTDIRDHATTACWHFAQKCIELVREKLTVFLCRQDIVGIYVSLAFRGANMFLPPCNKVSVDDNTLHMHAGVTISTDGVFTLHGIGDYIRDTGSAQR